MAAGTCTWSGWLQRRCGERQWGSLGRLRLVSNQRPLACEAVDAIRPKPEEPASTSRSRGDDSFELIGDADAYAAKMVERNRRPAPTPTPDRAGRIGVASGLAAA